MKPLLDVQHRGTLGAEGRKRMEFDPESSAFLMGILTDLYSDPELAFIREYPTNAMDAHIAAGHNSPIVVTLPSDLSPLFVVRDFGVGMSVDDVYRFFNYGASSKRATNDAVGMLGLGCKSALSSTSQFTVIAIKDGIRATVLVTREEDGGGAVQVIDTAATDDPTGLEVRIPVSNPGSVCRKARDFFRFWAPGSVIVDGEFHPSLWDAAIDDATKIEGLSSSVLRLDPDVLLVGSLDDESPIGTRLDRDYIVMGNVPYPVQNMALYGNHRRGSRDAYVVARIPIGSAKIAPSREALQDSKATKIAYDTAREFVAAGAARMAQERINAAATHGEAVTLASKFSFAQQGSPFRYECRDVPAPGDLFRYPDLVTVDAAGVERRHPQNVVLSWYGAPDRHASRGNAASVRDAVGSRAVHVIGFRGKNLHRTAKRKILAAIEALNLPAATGWNRDRRPIFVYPEPFCGPWIDQATVLRWEDVDAIKLPAENQTTRATATLYRTLDAYGYITNHPEYPALADVVDLWVPTGLLGRSDQQRLSDLARHLGARVFIVDKRRAKKFTELHPAMPRATVWMAERVTEYRESLTDWDLFWIAFRGHDMPYDDREFVDGWHRAITGLLPGQVPSIIDPGFRDFCQRLLADDEDKGPDGTRLDRYWSMQRIANVLGIGMPKPHGPLTMAELRRHAATYPMFRFHSRFHNDAYMNPPGSLHRSVESPPTKEFIAYLNSTFAHRYPRWFESLTTRHG